MQETRASSLRMNRQPPKGPQEGSSPFDNLGEIRKDAVKEDEETFPPFLINEETGEVTFLEDVIPPPPPGPGVLPGGGASNAITYDFRHGKIPEGIEMFGGEPSLEVQQDKSTALVVPPNAFIKCRCMFFFPPPLAPQLLIGFVAVNVPANGGEYVNDYTLTMDVKLDSLPKDR